MPEAKKRTRTAAQAAAEKKYKASKTRFVGLSFNVATDADILAKLETVDNMQGYIKACIRADLKKEQGQN